MYGVRLRLLGQAYFGSVLRFRNGLDSLGLRHSGIYGFHLLKKKKRVNTRIRGTMTLLWRLDDSGCRRC